MRIYINRYCIAIQGEKFVRMKRYIASMIAATVLAVMSAGSAVAHGVVDQSFEVPGGAINTLNGTRDFGQTFKPTKNTLIAVDLHLAGVGTNVRVSIHSGNPAGTELTSVTQTITANGWVHFDFPAAIALTPSNTYSIRMKSLSGNPAWTWRQINFGPPDYADGDAWICNPNCATTIFDFNFRTYGEDVDSDGDGVLNSDDFCPGTAIPEGVPTVQLRPNRWALINGDLEFDTVTKGKGKGPNRSYLVEDTAGCSCEQIIEAQGLGLGHTYHGCSISAMDDWVELVNP